MVLLTGVKVVGATHPLDEVALLVHGVESRAGTCNKEKHVM